MKTTLLKLSLFALLMVGTLQSGAQCITNFSFTIGNGGNVTFTASGVSNGNTNYFWNFGNNITSGQSTSTTAAVTYTTNQVYNVTLYIADSVSMCFTNITKTVSITNVGCNMNLSIFNTMAPMGQVYFSSNANSSPSTFAWQFGDGGTSSQQNPAHTYSVSGSYTVVLVLTTPSAICTYTAVKTISVSVVPCSIAANYTYTFGSNGVVNFGSTTTGASQNAIFMWNFGDNTMAYGSTTTHTYNGSSPYNVLLTVSDSSNTFCQDTSLKVVNVTNAPCLNNSSFVISKDSVQNLTWNAYPSFPNNVTAVVWSFGDGSTSNSMYPSHTYSAAGFYTLCVSTTVSCGTGTTFCIGSNIYRPAAGSESQSMITLNVLNPNSPVGLKSNFESNFKVTLFPNPAGESLNIELHGLKIGDNADVKVYNLIGKIVGEKSLTVNEDAKQTMDLSNLSEGVYLVTVKSGRLNSSTRLIIQK